MDYEDALICAAYARHVEPVRLLLEKGTFSDPMAIRHEVLWIAASRGCLQMVKMMLDQGANVNARDFSYDRALEKAARDGHASIVELLLDRGATLIYDGNSYDAFTGATYSGNLDIVRFLLNRGADINSHRWKGPSINIAARYNYAEILQFLLDNGADLGWRDSGTSSLEMAVRLGHQQIVRILLKAGVDVNFLPDHREPLVVCAKKAGHDNMVPLLLEYGAKNIDLSSN